MNLQKFHAHTDFFFFLPIILHDNNSSSRARRDASSAIAFRNSLSMQSVQRARLRSYSHLRRRLRLKCPIARKLSWSIVTTQLKRWRYYPLFFCFLNAWCVYRRVLILAGSFLIGFINRSLNRSFCSFSSFLSKRLINDFSRDVDV